MLRTMTGESHITTVGDEQVRAFVPFPLPPDPPVEMNNSLKDLHDSALFFLGRLDGFLSSLPDKDIFLYQYIRAEAVMSSRIEGIQSTLPDLFEYEITGHPFPADVVEVSNCMLALEHGLRRVREDGFPLSNRLIREMHEILFSNGQGSGKTPGAFRQSQNWVGGSRPGNARFVPPPPTEVENCLAALERFLHAKDDGISPLIRAGLAHVQFETIHPFLDGNGRTGRLLITLMLCEAGVLSEPLLYLSLYLKKHREAYYDLLNKVREGDWEAWLEFFLDGVRETAQSAVDTTRRILELFPIDEEKISQQGRKAGSVLRVHTIFKRQPVLSHKVASEQAGLSYPAVASAMESLLQLGIIEEITGKSRNRIYTYRQYLHLLVKATDDSD